MKRIIKLDLIVLPLLIVLWLAWSNACAVQRSKAPQINPKTVAELNLTVQLDQVNKDYIQFFKDVGAAQRAGQLSDSQVAALNGLGHKLKVTLESANALLKTYVQTDDQALPARIGALIIEAVQVYTNLVTMRADMLGGRVR